MGVSPRYVVVVTHPTSSATRVFGPMREDRAEWLRDRLRVKLAPAGFNQPYGIAVRACNEGTLSNALAVLRMAFR